MNGMDGRNEFAGRIKAKGPEESVGSKGGSFMDVHSLLCNLCPSFCVSFSLSHIHIEE